LPGFSVVAGVGIVGVGLGPEFAGVLLQAGSVDIDTRSTAVKSTSRKAVRIWCSIERSSNSSTGLSSICGREQKHYAFQMRIVGHGIDLVEVARIRRLLDEHGQRFLDRVFTPTEQAYCAARPKRYAEHLSGRFAAKEAVLKVLGTGMRGQIAWTDIEVTKDVSGQPGIALVGECARIAGSLGIDQWLVSISHIESHATASAIGVASAG